MFIVKTIKNFISKSECSTIIKENIKNELINATVGIKRELKESIRKSQIQFIDNEYIKNKLISELKNIIFLKGFNVAVVNQFQFTKYSTNGYYDWHMDYNADHDRFSRRFFSAVIQLNDEYEGGELMYRDLDGNEYIFEKGIGNLYVFNSSVYHKVSPISKGERFSLVNWLSVEEIKNFKKTLL